jgi:hypothetical protein
MNGSENMSQALQTTTSTAIASSAREPVKVTKKEVLPILKAIGEQGTRCRRFSVRTQEVYTVNNGDLVWQEGSKTKITFLRRQGAGWLSVSASDVMPDAITEGGATMRGNIPQDVLIVEHWHFSGAGGFTFVVAPTSAFLPASLPPPWQRPRRLRGSWSNAMATAPTSTAPQRKRLPDGRLEVRTKTMVLLESLDQGPVVRVELYHIIQRGPYRGLEMFKGYLNDPRTPGRIAALRLWMESVPGVPKIPFTTAMELSQRVVRLQALAILARPPLRLIPYLPG